MDYLLLFNYHADFLAEQYRRDDSLSGLSFDEQARRIGEAAMCVGGAYAHYLEEIGCSARMVIVNADVLQARWALENGVLLRGDVHARRRQVVAAQIERWKPRVLYVFEWCPLSEAFLEEMRSGVGLVAGQIASPLHPKRTYRYCDLMFSSYRPLVDYFRSQGMDSEMLGLGFDPRVLERVRGRTRERQRDLDRGLDLGDPAMRDSATGDLDVTFVGGFAPSHPDRAAFLEEVAAEVPLRVFGYGVETLAAGSRVRACHGGEVWGAEMFSVLGRSKIMLNHHARIDVPGQEGRTWANNMRLYEATGMGTLLLTDWREGLTALFEPDAELVVYRDARDCVKKIRRYLADEAARSRIAAAGQARTLSDHTYLERVRSMHEMVCARLGRRPCDRPVQA